MTEQQIDKIKGVFFGQAIGDALGLGTEFLSKNDIALMYPNGLKGYSDIVRDKHRSRWEVGDWTDDTDQFLCICNSIIKNNVVSELHFATELFDWFKGSPMGIGQTVNKVLSLPQFTLYPHKAAELVWKVGKKNVASNGAIMRTSVLGTYDFWDIAKVIENTEKIAKVTHWDPRCVGSCVVITAIISNILRDNKYLSVEEIKDLASAYDVRIVEFLNDYWCADVVKLNLEEQSTMGFTLKALVAGLWAYFYADDFEQGILKIIHEGGDADTNACVAGSLLGAKFGFQSIPTKWINELKYKNELELVFENYIKCVQSSEGV
jgi:ADP-ribosylglycohydrolase